MHLIIFFLVAFCVLSLDNKGTAQSVFFSPFISSSLVEMVQVWYRQSPKKKDGRTNYPFKKKHTTNHPSKKRNRLGWQKNKKTVKIFLFFLNLYGTTMGGFLFFIFVRQSCSKRLKKKERILKSIGIY